MRDVFRKREKCTYITAFVYTEAPRAVVVDMALLIEILVVLAVLLLAVRACGCGCFAV
jgi:hypothetical protein